MQLQKANSNRACKSVLEEASAAATQHSVNMTMLASSKKLSCSRCAELQQHWLQRHKHMQHRHVINIDA